MTTANQVIERTIAREVVRTPSQTKQDYTIVLLTEDLPPGIEPLRVADLGEIADKYPDGRGGYNLKFATEQGGQVSAGVPGFMADVGKGGDSGSAILFPIRGELVFLNGVSTSGASAAMQADMDELCRMERLDPQRYQMRWVHFPGYPTYPKQ